MAMKPPWYSEEADFFGWYYRQTYKGLLTTAATQKEVRFVENALELGRSDRVLDLACGHGRHAIELARRGYNVTGQDLHTAFLSEAQRAATEAGVIVRWIQGDMRHIPFVGEFRAVVSMFSSFGYLETDAEDQKVLCQIASALHTGGVFFLDFHNREKSVRNSAKRTWKRYDDGTIELVERSFDFRTGRDHDRLTRIWPDGTHVVRDVHLRHYTVAELVKMCAAAGLAVDGIWGDFMGSPLEIDSPCVLMVARKV